MSVARRVSAATVPAAGAGAAAAKAPVLTDDALSSSFLTKGACADVKRFLLAAQTGVPAAPKFRKIIQFALDAITTETVSAELQSALDADAELSVAFIGAHLLLSQAIKARVKDRDFSNTLLKEFALAPAYADELCRALAASSAGGQRALLEAAAAAPTIEFPALTQMRWRTDVTISTAALERVFRPTVVMQMTLSDGSIKQFECTPERFQDLRFQAALVLRNMQSLAKHPTLVMNAEQQQ